MIGSFLTRGLVMVFGYAYPAYECYKSVEMNKPEIEQLRFWCQYWVPMYSEAKLAFFVYLWYPKTKGTSYVYDSFFRPYVAKHENEIDRNLLELRTRAGDIAVLYWQRAASYGQTRVFEILQYVASQSTPRPRPNQSQQNAGSRPPPTASNRQPSNAKRPEPEEPPSPTSSTSSSEHLKEVAEEVGPLQVPETAPLARASSLQKANSSISSTQKALTPSNSQQANSAASNVQKASAASESTSQSKPTEAEAMHVDPASSAADEIENPPQKETMMEETIRMTRGRLRKNRSASNR